MQKLINTLKNNINIKTIYSTKDEKIILVENKDNILFIINTKGYRDNDGEQVTYGYQYTHPILPNRTTGSGMMGTGDCWDYIDFDHMVHAVKTIRGYIMPQFFSDKDREATKFYKSIDQKLNNQLNIFTKKIK